MSTGIVSTARIQHATPAATYADSQHRDWESDAELSEEAKANGCRDIAREPIEFGDGDGPENASRALTDTIALSDAVRVATQKTLDEDTLITADHRQTFSIAGYPDHGNDILGKDRPGITLPLYEADLRSGVGRH